MHVLEYGRLPQLWTASWQPASLNAARVDMVSPHGVALLFLACTLAVASQCHRTRFLPDVVVCHLQSTVSKRPHVSLGTDEPASRY